MNSNCLISIIVAVYNAEKYISLTIQSVLNQRYQNWELILVDDGSSDRTVDIIKSYSDDRIRCFLNRTNAGMSARLNEAILYSRGEYIARMDADDAMFDERLFLQKEFMDKNPKVDVVGSYAVAFNDNNELIGMMESKIPVNFEELVITGSCFIHPTVMARKEWYLKNQYDAETGRVGDFELWVKAYKTSCFHVIEEPLLFYRTTGIQPKWKYKEGLDNYKKILRKHADKINYKIHFKALFRSYFKYRLHRVFVSFGWLNKINKIAPSDLLRFQSQFNKILN